MRQNLIEPHGDAPTYTSAGPGRRIKPSELSAHGSYCK